MSTTESILVNIHTPYIQLGQFLKLAGLIGHGGEAKQYLVSKKVLVQGEAEARRGRKLYHAYTIVVEYKTYMIQSL
jgi:ribosome-associated protein YbcJ (S4-like RNA binding protein)